MSEIKTLNTIPEKVIIPLKQHCGEACEPLVNVGDPVIIGQKIGDISGCCSAPVHSSVCGEVISIEDAPHPNGNKVRSIIIKPDENGETVEFLVKPNSSASELISIIKDAGIVEHYGMPTHAVLKPEGEKIDTVIINATCPEWLSGYCEAIYNSPSHIVEGLELLMKAAGASKGAIVIRNDAKNYASAFESVPINGKSLSIAPLIGKRRIDYYFDDMGSNMVVVSKNRTYKQNMANLLAYDVTGSKVPLDCGPEHVGVAICSVKSAKELYDAVHEGKPCFETIVSVKGFVNDPQKIRVKIGTTFKDVIDACGGYKGDPGMVIANGTTSGTAQYTDEVPVAKSTTGIHVMSREEILTDGASVCIHCARCVDVCPVNLIPSRIATLADQGRFDECRGMNVMNCLECGECAATCPSKIHMLQLIRYAKFAIEKAYSDVAPKESSNLELGCESCGGT